MAGNIKGITIEFRGNTTELEQAIKRVNAQTKAIDSELKKVNNALKFNPKNVELLRQKQTLLNDRIKETTDKLDALKAAKKEADRADSGIDKNSAEYRELQREIIETESKLKHFKGQLTELGNVRLTALSKQFKELGGNMISAGKTMTTKVTAPLVAGYTVAAKYASDYEENLNKLDVAFGENSDSVKEWAETARNEFGLSKVQASEAAASFGALGKGIGLSNGEAADMSMTLGGLSADLGSYFNVGTDESAKALEGIFTGESEALKKFGVVMNDTNLAAFAAEQGLVWKEMDQTQKVMLRYQFVMAKTQDAQGDFARTSDGTANSIKIFKATVQDLATAIGTNLLPIITPIIQKITEWVNKFNELSPETQKIITYVGLLAAALGPLLIVLGTLISSMGSIIGAASKMIPLIAKLAKGFNPWLLVLGAAVAAGVYLYKNWDTIKAKAQELWNKVKTVFNGIREAIIGPIEAAVERVRNAFNKIKSIFSGKLEFPKIKLPHFNITGKFSLNPPQVPHLNIDWYKQGGIFANGPQVIGVGEAGAEAVIPLDTLWSKMDRIAEGSGQTNNFYITGDDPKQIAKEVEKILIKDTNRRRLAWQ